MDGIILPSRTENYISFTVLVSFRITTESIKVLFGIWHLRSFLLSDDVQSKTMR